VQFDTFFRELTASHRHEIALFFYISYHLARFFATILTKFALYSMNLVLPWHFQVPFCNLGQACEHFMLAITGVWQVKFLCFYSKSLSKSSVLVFQSWGAGPMTTVCYGWTCITALSLQSVRLLHSHAWAGYSKSLSKSSVLVDQSWGAGPMTTICNGWTCITTLFLQSVRLLHSHAWTGFLFLGRDHGEVQSHFSHATPAHARLCQ